MIATSRPTCRNHDARKLHRRVGVHSPTALIEGIDGTVLRCRCRRHHIRSEIIEQPHSTCSANNQHGMECMSATVRDDRDTQIAWRNGCLISVIFSRWVGD